jgi:2'-5' RNA ligase
MRLFFALWPDDALRAELAEARLEVARLSGGRPTLPVTMHMTLVFCGNVPDKRVLEMQMVAARAQLRAFDYVVDTAGCFAGPKVAWLASDSPPKALFDLQQTLYQSISGAGFDVDARTFRPHITVARSITSAFEPYPILPVTWRVNRFSLVEAVQSGNSIRYDILDAWPLVG